MEPGEEVMTVNEIAAKYKVSVSTVYTRVRSGEWPALHIGSNVRLYASEIEEAIRSRNPWARSRMAQTRRANAARRAGRQYP